MKSPWLNRLKSHFISHIGFRLIERAGGNEAPIRVSLFGRSLDLKQTGMKLTQGGVYTATCGDRKVAFKIADNAGVAPVVTLQRIVRF